MNIAVMVHFQVQALDGRDLTRDEARACIEHAIKQQLLVLSDEENPQPFVQLSVPDHGIANITLSMQDDDEDLLDWVPDHEFPTESEAQDRQ